MPILSADIHIRILIVYELHIGHHIVTLGQALFKFPSVQQLDSMDQIQTDGLKLTSGM